MPDHQRDRPNLTTVAPRRRQLTDDEIDRLEQLRAAGAATRRRGLAATPDGDDHLGAIAWLAGLLGTDPRTALAELTAAVDTARDARITWPEIAVALAGRTAHAPPDADDGNRAAVEAEIARISSRLRRWGGDDG